MKVLLFSGGPDSLIAYWWLRNIEESLVEKDHLYKRDSILPLYVPLGHKYEAQEHDICLELNRKWGLGVRILKDTYPLGRHFEKADANIPARNLLLCLIAANFIEFEDKGEIVLVVQEGEMKIPDRSKKFFRDTSEMLSFLFEKGIIVWTPFENMSKVEMVKWFLEFDWKTTMSKKQVERQAREDMLKETRSCYSSGDAMCGSCAACFRRWVAFSLNGIEESYSVVPWTSTVARTYVDGVKYGKYKGKRADEIILAMRKVGVDVEVG